MLLARNPALELMKDNLSWSDIAGANPDGGGKQSSFTWPRLLQVILRLFSIPENNAVFELTTWAKYTLKHPMPRNSSRLLG
ncbi:MAG: hypothetical protein ACXWF8_04955 [Methylobacter sp.]